ncbi:MAG TPA: Ig domain-containing protein [Blastocatellia bacterium]|nr:Ig domain-containing protein [Blastocatellia bacterium]
MRRITSVSLISVLAFQYLLGVALAQSQLEVYFLPSGQAGVPYMASIDQVLRETYKLKLDSSTGASGLRWSYNAGTLPPGLKINADGTISGTPAAGRDRPYVFRARVTSGSGRAATFLDVDLSISIEKRTLQLVPDVAPARVDASSRLNDDPPSAVCGDIERMKNNSRVTAPPQADPDHRALMAVDCSATLPDPVMPSDARADAKRVVLDARQGYVDGLKRFGLGDEIIVVVDNKNPYLFKYQYSSARSGVSEGAIATFLPLLGGIVAEVAKPPEEAKPEPAAPAATEAARAAASARFSQPPITREPPPCQEAWTELAILYARTRCASDYSEETSRSLRELKHGVNALNETYNARKKGLENPELPRPALCRDSLLFLDATKTASYTPKVNEISNQLEDQLKIAAGFSAKINDLLSRFPNCIRALDFRKIEAYSEQLSAAVKKNQEVLDQVRKLIAGVNETRNKVALTLENPIAFVETHRESDFSESTNTAITVKLTPLSKDIEAPKDPYSFNLSSGKAPFFSMTAGLVFSSLRKLEYQRVQGFELDRQGNLVLDENGNPRTGPVIGLKEGSRTRISPSVMLNGRFYQPRSAGWLSGIHASLGITAKNDNKGTDLEFLVGPSFSFLEDKIFFTLGGYAGRQQKLEGRFFEGQAAPPDLGELPIRKDYRWSVGFALTYRLPINTGEKK